MEVIEEPAIETVDDTIQVLICYPKNIDACNQTC